MHLYGVELGVDISAIATAASNLAQYKTASDVQLAVFKKTVDISAQNSLQLIQAVRNRYLTIRLILAIP
nr:YjfB family protein [uncultured Methylotenera sp.]